MTVTVAAKAWRLQRWTVHHDNRLRDTGGKYAAIAALSDEWGVESRVLLARLHRLRAGDVAAAGEAIDAVPRVSAPQAESATRQDDLPGPAGPATQTVEGRVPPTMYRIVHALEVCGQATYAELEGMLGLPCKNVGVQKAQNRARLVAAGWRIASDGERPATFWLERVT